MKRGRRKVRNWFITCFRSSSIRSCIYRHVEESENVGKRPDSYEDEALQHDAVRDPPVLLTLSRVRPIDTASRCDVPLQAVLLFYDGLSNPSNNLTRQEATCQLLKTRLTS